MTRGIYLEMSKNLFSHIHALHASCIHAFSPSNSYSRSLPPVLHEDKISHRYGTHASTRRKMAKEEQRFAKVEVDIDEVRGNVLKILEMIQSLSITKEAVNSKALEASTSVVLEPVVPRFQNTWTEFGLPPNFTPAGYQEPVQELVPTQVHTQTVRPFQIPATTAKPRLTVHTPFVQEDPQYMFDTPRSEAGSAADE